MMNSVNLSRSFFHSRLVWSTFCVHKCHLSRSVPGVIRTIPRSAIRSQVSPRLIDSVEERISFLRQEIDLGQGPAVQESKDVLQETFIRAISIEHVKELIALHYRNMSALHVSECMQTIFNLVKYSDNGEALSMDLLASKEFVLLANRALKVARYLEPSEALNTLLVVDKLGISMDTMLSQALLQMIRYSINELTINELHKLTILIKRIQKTKATKGTLIDALIFALPHAVKNRINYKEMDFDNARLLLHCLDMISFFGTENFSDMDALYKCLQFTDQTLHHLNLQECIRLLTYIYSLSVINPDLLALCKSISSKCIDRITSADKNEFEHFNIPSSLWNLVLTKMRENKQFFDGKLYKFIRECAVTYSNFSDKDLLYILSQNEYYKVVDFNMLTYFAQMMQERDSPIFLKNSKISPLQLWQHFTLPSNREEICADFDIICENIVTSPYFISETQTGNSKSRIACFYFIKNCLLLNTKLKEGFIKKCFSIYLDSAFEELNARSQRNHALELAIHLYNGLLINKKADLSDEVAQLLKVKLTPYIEEYTFLLTQGLASAEKDPTIEEIQNYMSDEFQDWQLTQNVIESGLVIDVLAEKDDRRIGFFLFDRKNFCYDSGMLTGQSQFNVETMRNCAIQPIIINRSRWTRWTSAEKALFIKNEKQHALSDPDYVGGSF